MIKTELKIKLDIRTKIEIKMKLDIRITTELEIGIDREQTGCILQASPQNYVVLPSSKSQNDLHKLEAVF